VCSRLPLPLPPPLLLLPILKTVVPTFVHPWWTACCSSAHVNARLRNNVRRYAMAGRHRGTSSAVGVCEVRCGGWLT
jgi:hypothetical protein